MLIEETYAVIYTDGGIACDYNDAYLIGDTDRMQMALCDKYIQIINNHRSMRVAKIQIVEVLERCNNNENQGNIV